MFRRQKHPESLEPESEDFAALDEQRQAFPGCGFIPSIDGYPPRLSDDGYQRLLGQISTITPDDMARCRSVVEKFVSGEYTVPVDEIVGYTNALRRAIAELRSTDNPDQVDLTTCIEARARLEAALPGSVTDTTTPSV